jgi:hypothetical protein
MAVKPGNGGNGERDPRLELLYRDAAREVPPAHLDAAILAAARREAGSRPRALSALRRWRVPISLAAVVVLSVSVVTLVEEEGRDSPAGLRSTPAPPVARPAEPQARPAAPEPKTRKQTAVSAPEELSLRRDEAASVAEVEPRRRAAERQQAPSSTAPAADPDAGAAPPPAVAGGVFSYQPRESPARPEADAAQRPAPSAGIRGSAADTAPRAAASQPKPLADNRRMQAEQAFAVKRAPVWQGLEQEPPQKWLERLAELKRQGRTGEANELLAELKRRFPDYPLPSGLE